MTADFTIFSFCFWNKTFHRLSISFTSSIKFNGRSSILLLKMLRKKIYFLAYIFIGLNKHEFLFQCLVSKKSFRNVVVIRSEKCRCSLLDPPPEITCSLLCKDDFINDLEQLLSDSTNGMDFEKLVYNWKNLFERASIEQQKYICW